MPLPTIPTVEDLAADTVTHHYDDLVAPSGLTNFLGTVRVEHDLTAIGAVTFPPVSQGLATTGVLFFQGRVFESYGVPVSHTWRPDRVLRSAQLDDWLVETTTVCVPGEPVVVVEVVLENLAADEREATVGLSLNARVRCTEDSWLDAESPSARNEAAVGPDRLEFTGPDGATSIQGVDTSARVRLSGVAPAEDGAYDVGIGGAGRGGEVTVRRVVPAGERTRFAVVHAVDRDAARAAAAYARVITDTPAAIRAAEEFWNHQLRSVFTPGNAEYSGHLPVLETEDPALRSLYWWGALGTVWFRREYAGNVLGRSYDTLMPNYWSTTTFIWDYSLSSLTHALLDPEPMRRQLEHWIASDTSTHFGTSSLSGGPVGRWYSVNDYAMTRLVDDHIRVNGATGWLATSVAGRPISDHLAGWARAWRRRRQGSALADYGEIDNLLECVSSYTHEVASLNAANVWCLRTAADLLGDPRLGEEADQLLPHVLDLHEEGTGWFAARQPDGSRLPVRHCYDFSVVGTTIADDLPPGVPDAMVDFFRRELQTPNWIRALSPWDPDASFSVRPDHQWNGAYPAWPADAARALVALGHPELALAWLPGLADSANQGPPGQGHFTDEAMPPIGRGARKAPPQLPYIIDWSCSSAGAFVALVIESLFGVRHDADGTVTASGVLAEHDPTAALRGLRAGDHLVDVLADGTVHPHTG